MGLFSKLFQSNEKNFVSPMTGKVVAMSDIPVSYTHLDVYKRQVMR